VRNSTAASLPSHHQMIPLNPSARADQKQVQKPLSRRVGSWAWRWKTVRSSVSITTTKIPKASQWPNWIALSAAGIGMLPTAKQERPSGTINGALQGRGFARGGAAAGTAARKGPDHEYTGCPSSATSWPV